MNGSFGVEVGEMRHIFTGVVVTVCNNVMVISGNSDFACFELSCIFLCICMSSVFNVW